MKIFLSHSSADKWLARRIASDLGSLGAHTFLDEKDIATGESIDAAIQSHLGDCSDFLILLSPASIKSEWVLVELGGALALKKQVIPIFLYLGANDIPKPISKIKGRDIADIEKYYDELKARVAKVAASNPPMVAISLPRKKHRRSRVSKFSVGDTVLLPKGAQSTAFREITPITWNNEMEKYCGLVARITTVFNGLGAVRVDTDNGKWVWAEEWLAKKKTS